MAEAAEKFRREMDAMREELQGPKIDPVSRGVQRIKACRRSVTDLADFVLRAVPTRLLYRPG